MILIRVSGFQSSIDINHQSTLIIIHLFDFSSPLSRLLRLFILLILNLLYCRAPRPVLFGPLPVSYPSLTRHLPDPYLILTWPLLNPYPPLPSLGISRSHEGTGTETIFDFSPPTTRKLFRSLYSPLPLEIAFNINHSCTFKVFW